MPRLAKRSLSDPQPYDYPSQLPQASHFGLMSFLIMRRCQIRLLVRGRGLVARRSEEGLLIADIDLSTIDFAKQMIDVVGHYSRPDLLSLNVNTEAAKHVDIK